MNPRSLLDQLLYPHEAYTALRESGPVLYNEQARLWEIFTYNDVHTVISDHERFSSDGSKFSSEFASDGLDKTILNLDPPRHRQLRSLVTQAFAPRTIEQLAPRIAEITHELLDKVIDRGSMDVIDDLSYPLPVIVIAEMLGIPTEDRGRFKKWSDDLVTMEYDNVAPEDIDAYNKQVRERVRQTLDELYAYLRLCVDERRRQPGHDLISRLIQAQEAGESLSEDELLAFCALLLIAGNITTTNLLGDALLCFDEHPEVMERMRGNPALIPSAIEEVLRYRSPVTVIGRFAATDVMVAGQRIERGQFIVSWVACANHDPTQFPQPEQFDITRTPNRHLTFGHGIHFCLGAPLARLEAKIALNILFQRLRDIRRDRDQGLESIHSTFIYGPKHVPITFCV